MTRRKELVLAGIGVLLVLVAATLLLVRPTRQATAEANAERDAAVTESQTLRDQSATGDSAQATADAATSADELSGNIVLTVFQLAQSSGAPSTPAATASPGAQVR